MNQILTGRWWPTCLVVVVGVAACDCDGDPGPAAGDQGVSCPADQASPGGVGVPCGASGDCDRNPSLSCPSRTDASGIRFCTKYCDYAATGSEECGPGASCTYVGSGGRCVPDGCAQAIAKPPPTSKDTTAGRVNDWGVGQPCRTFHDCTGQSAKLCEHASRDGGFDFCTSDCAYSLGDDLTQCGSDASCVYVGGGRGRCVPTKDADRLKQEPPPIPEVTVPCCLDGPVNELGVGLTCTRHSDCSGNKGASSCPYQINPTLPNWCSFLCDFDSAGCGGNAFCWWRPSIDGGMVGSCVPDACRTENNPPACPAEKATPPAPAPPAPGAPPPR